MALIYLLAWIMSVVSSCAVGVGIATGHEIIGATISVVAAVIAISSGVYILKNGKD